MKNLFTLLTLVFLCPVSFGQTLTVNTSGTASQGPGSNSVYRADRAFLLGMRDTAAWPFTSIRFNTTAPVPMTNKGAIIFDSVAKKLNVGDGVYWKTLLSEQLAAGLYEPKFAKNSAFNKSFGTTSGTVKPGDWMPNAADVGAYPQPTGSADQYVRGDGSIATFPTIPAAQVRSDWNATSGLSVIDNKPSLGTAAAANSADFATAAQGTLAASALQPSGNGSALTGLTKSQVGLSNVDNTADVAKNVLSATKLTTARNINGVAFDGSANITIPGSAVTSIPNASLSNSSITVNGQAVSLGGSVTVTASPNIGPYTSGISVTSGTAFQPNASGPCNIIVSGSLTGGVAGVYGTSVIAMSDTQFGTYTNVTPGISFFLSVLGVTDNRDSATINVPTGRWVRVTNTATGVGATLTSTYSRSNY